MRNNYKSKITKLLVLTILSSTFCSICNSSALSYGSNIGVGFTFNPTLSISLSPGDLVIHNLTPGTTEDSNSINVSVSTNVAYGYTLSATTNSNNLIHNDNNVNSEFNSIATNANLEALTTGNTWGYTTKLPSEANWSNYNGLSSSSGTILLDNNNTADSAGSIDFKISAKASGNQASGIYTGTITFIAVSKVAPMSLLDSFIASGAEQLNGYFKMQDMTHDICESVDIEESELQLIDIRDNKIYWVAKLKDGNCWMTQNLDLDIDDARTYTHYDTDLGWTTNDETATWQPTEGHSTINFTWNTVPGWQNSDTEPYSASPGDMYFYTSDSNEKDFQYYSLQECQLAGRTDCPHYNTGNYYNWPAAVASNDTSSLSSSNAPNSICPKSWRLPQTSNNEFGNVLVDYGIIAENTSWSYLDDGLNKIRQNPLYFARANCVTNANRPNWQLNGTTGYYWSSTTEYSNSNTLEIGVKSLRPKTNYIRQDGFSIRCLAR